VADTTISENGLRPMSMRMHRQPLRRQIIRQGLGIALSLVATASMARAHGGMAGPDDLGPPLFTSAALAFICYWVVILWPASKRKGSEDAPNGTKILADEDRRLARRSSKSAAPRPTSQLQKVQSKRARGGSGSGRKASDV
jgi:hypothetical protein